MKQSFLFSKTTKETPSGEQSINAKLLIKAGFVDKLSSGVYNLLPLGLRVLRKLEKIIRKEMERLEAQEILMPALGPKDNWLKTDRWKVKEMFKIENEDLGLNWTHEEVITPLMKRHLLSSKDFPKYVYQIQTKFRNEPRAKSGLLRCKEFIMKDLYSFHENNDDLDNYYERVKEAYFNIFNECGIADRTYLTIASGGTFSKYSHEFQTLTNAGEDTIFICENCASAVNKEIKEEKCPNCGGNKFREEKAIEIANIFKLGARYTNSFGFKNNIIMSCYGLGLTRMIGTIAEVLSDEKGLSWPKSLAPFNVHLVELEEGIGHEIYSILQKNNFEVLYDDRKDKTVGEKLNDADLIGIPLRVVIGKNSLEKQSIELKERGDKDAKFIKIKDFEKNVQKYI